MNDLSNDIDLDEPFGFSDTDIISEQSQSVNDGLINSTLFSMDNNVRFHNETMRLLFITIAIIIVLVCVTISTILCIFLCLNRYVEVIKFSDNKCLLFRGTVHENLSSLMIRVLRNKNSIVYLTSRGFIKQVDNLINSYILFT